MPRPSYQTTRRALTLTLLGVLCVYQLLVWVPDSVARRSTALDQLRLLVDLRHEIVQEYVEEPDQEAMVKAAVRGMISSLEDPYTQYLSPEDLKEFDKRIRGTFSGIGAEVDLHEDHVRVVSPLEDSPAWKSGVLPGDIILEIDGESTKGMALSDAVDRLIGQAGTVVNVKVKHKSGEEQDIAITRAQIDVPSVRALYRDENLHWQYMLDTDHNIAYLRLSNFSSSTVDDLRNILIELEEDGMQGLILDLRFNPGGLLDAAVDVSDMFLDEGQRIVSVKGRSTPEQVYSATDAGTITDVPVVVLANEASASASEILTGALSDNDRATFVGTRTFGKGSVQQIRMLETGQGALKITNAYYYLPNGRTIHRRPDAEIWGVDPADGYYVAMTPEQIEESFEIRRESDLLKPGAGDSRPQVSPQWLREELHDPQLAAGLETLLAKLSNGEWKPVGESNVQDIVMRLRRKEALEREKQLLSDRVEQIDEMLQAIAEGRDPDVDQDKVAEVIEEDQPEAAPEGAIKVEDGPAE